jgi:hypothetical protein
MIRPSFIHYSSNLVLGERHEDYLDGVGLLITSRTMFSTLEKSDVSHS